MHCHPKNFSVHLLRTRAFFYVTTTQWSNPRNWTLKCYLICRPYSKCTHCLNSLYNFFFFLIQDPIQNHSSDPAVTLFRLLVPQPLSVFHGSGCFEEDRAVVLKNVPSFGFVCFLTDSGYHISWQKFYIRDVIFFLVNHIRSVSYTWR